MTWVVQDEAYGRGQDFVDIKINIGSSACQLECRAATVRGGTYNKTLNKTSSATTPTVCRRLFQDKGAKSVSKLMKIKIWSSYQKSYILITTGTFFNFAALVWHLDAPWHKAGSSVCGCSTIGVVGTSLFPLLLFLLLPPSYSPSLFFHIPKVFSGVRAWNRNFLAESPPILSDDSSVGRRAEMALHRGLPCGPSVSRWSNWFRHSASLGATRLMVCSHNKQPRRSDLNSDLKFMPNYICYQVCLDCFDLFCTKYQNLLELSASRN